MLSTNSKVFKAIQVFIDVLLIFASCLISGKFFGQLSNFRAIIAIVLSVSFFHLLDLYSLTNKKFSYDIASVVISTVVCVFLTAIASIIFGVFKDAFPFYLGCYIISMVLITIVHIILDSYYIKTMNKKKILIIESTAIPSRLARKIKYSFPVPENVHYHIINEEDSKGVEELFNSVICHYDNIILSSGLSIGLQHRIFNYCMSREKTVSSFLDLEHATTMNGTITMYGDTVAVVSNPIHMSKIQLFVKRTFDLVFSSLLLVLTSPFFLICAALVKLDSEGPAIYKQERYTIGKKKFNCLKFRTMVVDSEKDGAKFSTKDDDRLTRVGKIIRKARLDELPQLWNVFKGEMSFVGPRPERPIFADFFCEKVQNYELRYLVKAGITGSAQVYGNYNSRASDKILLDLKYAVNYSLVLDIKLILLTIRQIFLHDSAEGDDVAFELEMNKEERELARYNNSTFKEEENEEKEDISYNSGI